MKRLTLIFLCSFAFTSMNSQDIDFSKINSSNTWFKLGLNIGVPVGDLADASSLSIGPEISVQYLKTKAVGIGLKAGYTHYVAKDDLDDFSSIPLAFLFRYYPESTGFFAGFELGYAFINNIEGTSGGPVTRPHIGWHTDNWNFFGYYNHIVTEDEIPDFQSVGLGVTYNLRFNKK